MDAINDLAMEHGLVVIEDAAQALGSKDSRGRLLGTISHTGCFSLSVAKIISTGQGGFIVTRDPQLNDRIRNMRTHGVENVLTADEWGVPGFNFRFTDVLASIGLIQLGLLEERIARLREVGHRYAELLEGAPGVSYLELRDGELGPYVEVLAEDRQALTADLAGCGIETRRFYPALDEAPYWAAVPDLPNSRIFAGKGLYLPSGPSISDSQIVQVAEAVNQFSR
jgi:dTDP-4-amino-4,6-dideoxygalactose transaminase